MSRTSIGALVLALVATLWFLAGLPDSVDIAPPVNELPSALQPLNAIEPLDLQYHPGLKTQRVGQHYLSLIGGTFEQRFNIDLCQVTLRGVKTPEYKQGIPKASKYMYVGLSLAQIQARDSSYTDKTKLIDDVRAPILDQPNTAYDLPGFAIKGDKNQSYNIKLIEKNMSLITDSIALDYIDANEDAVANMVKHAFVSNDNFTVVLKKQTDYYCDIGQFTVDVYRHQAQAEKLVYYLDDTADINSELKQSKVIAGHYPPPSITKYGVQSLVENMTACQQIKEIKGQWTFASRYHYNSQTPLDDFDPIQSKHCQKVLATFYHTPAGNVVRKRAHKLFNYAKPLIAITGEGLVDVSAQFNKRPVMIEHSPLSLYQNILMAYDDLNKKSVWHKVYQGKASFVLPALAKQTNVYVLGKDIQVSGTKILAQSKQCFKSLCDASSDVMKLSLAATTRAVTITASGIKQTVPLLQQNVVQLGDKPSIQHAICNDECKAQKADRVSADHDTKFTVVDRNNETLTIDDAPHLLAPRGGRVNSSMANKVQLTIDKQAHKRLQDILDEYMLDSELEAKFATLTMVNAQGEILALAQTPQLKNDTNFERAGYEQAYRPFDSPLTFKAAYHDGSSNYVSGSVMKLLSSLLITNELGAEHPFIKGLTSKQWYKLRHQTQMNPKMPCYPSIDARCAKKHIKNFIGPRGIYTIDNHSNQQSYGLKQALRDSRNSYFAFMVSKVGNEPLYNQQAFGKDGFSQSSKLRHFVSQFGFYAPLKLDAGLLGEDINSTVFITPASELSYKKEEQFWRGAVGEQNKVTALQVAQFTLAIANEKLIPLSLLKSLDDKKANINPQVLNIKPESYNFVQDAMALAGGNYNSIKSLPEGISFYAKSGTGEITAKNKHSKSLNNVWMTSYIHPDSPIVLTCQIASVKGVSTLCAKLIEKVFSNADKIPALKLVTPPQQQGKPNDA